MQEGLSYKHLLDKIHTENWMPSIGPGQKTQCIGPTTIGPKKAVAMRIRAPPPHGFETPDEEARACRDILSMMDDVRRTIDECMPEDPRYERWWWTVGDIEGDGATAVVTVHVGYVQVN